MFITVFWPVNNGSTTSTLKQVQPMNIDFAKAINEYNNNSDYEGVFEYSGRGMCGKTTNAIKVDNLWHFHSILASIIEDATDDQDTKALQLVAQGLKNVRFDKLGHEMVVY